MRARKSELGFTFIEVLLAVTILAVAASIAIGLQSASIGRTIDDKMSQRALLAGRRILSMIEVDEKNIQNLEKEGPLSNLFDQYKIPLPDNQDERASLDNITGRISISDWELPKLSKGGMKKISLLLSWGDEDQNVELVYFAPSPDPG